MRQNVCLYLGLYHNVCKKINRQRTEQNTWNIIVYVLSCTLLSTAKQGDNEFGGIRLSIHLFVCLSELSSLVEYAYQTWVVYEYSCSLGFIHGHHPPHFEKIKNILQWGRKMAKRGLEHILFKMLPLLICFLHFLSLYHFQGSKIIDLLNWLKNHRRHGMHREKGSRTLGKGNFSLGSSLQPNKSIHAEYTWP